MTEIITVDVTAPTTWPNRTDRPETIRTDADTWFDWHGGTHVPELTELISQINLAADFFTNHVNAVYLSTSVSSVTIPTVIPASKTFTLAETSRAYSPGMEVVIGDIDNPSVNYMSGRITAYSGIALTVDISAIAGSGTKSNWAIAASPAGGAAAVNGCSVNDAGTSTTDLWTASKINSKLAGINIGGGSTTTESAVDITLTSVSTRVQIVSMTAPGKSMILPDATTENKGVPEFVIKNAGDYDFNIKNNSGAVLDTVKPGSVATTALEDNSTTDGNRFIIKSDLWGLLMGGEEILESFAMTGIACAYLGGGWSIFVYIKNYAAYAVSALNGIVNLYNNVKISGTDYLADYGLTVTSVNDVNNDRAAATYVTGTTLKFVNLDGCISNNISVYQPTAANISSVGGAVDVVMVDINVMFAAFTQTNTVVYGVPINVASVAYTKGTATSLFTGAYPTRRAVKLSKLESGKAFAVSSTPTNAGYGRVCYNITTTSFSVGTSLNLGSSNSPVGIAALSGSKVAMFNTAGDCYEITISGTTLAIGSADTSITTSNFQYESGSMRRVSPGVFYFMGRDTGTITKGFLVSLSNGNFSLISKTSLNNTSYPVDFDLDDSGQGIVGYLPPNNYPTGITVAILR